MVPTLFRNAFPSLLLALACLAGASTPARADTCLNTDKQKYGDGDARSYDYGKCKSTTPDQNYNSLSAVGSQMQGIMERREAESNASMQAYQAERKANWENGGRDAANARYRLLKNVTADEAGHYSERLKSWRNASISTEQQQPIRDEIGAAIAQDKLLEQYGDAGYDKPAAWVGGADAAANWKQCEVATQLSRAYVYGAFIKPEQKNPAKGFAIARSGCDAGCGGTCYWLGRIFEDGDKAAPGVDKVLDTDPQKLTLIAYDTAIMNGVPAAYEREAGINWHVPERYRNKEYIRRSGLSFSKTPYWLNDQNDTRLAYRQYQRCLKLEPANLACAENINAMIRYYRVDGPDAQRGTSGRDEYSPDADIRREIEPADITYYADYLKNLQQLLAQAAAAP